MEEKQVSEDAPGVQAEATSHGDTPPSSQSTPPELLSRKQMLVPWSSWKEWEYVRASLFSSSPDSIAAALRRISAWRARGCLPGVIEVTAAIVEIQQKDAFFRKDLPPNIFSDSDEILAMCYCMSILRVANVVVEKLRQHRGLTFTEAADEVGLPRMLIDVRHEGAHRELPSLSIVRDASVQAVNWLKFFYWEPQKTRLTCEDESSRARNEINAKLRELILLMKSGKSKKSLKISKVLTQLHTSYSLGVVASLVELMQSVASCHSQEVHLDLSMQAPFADWKILQHVINDLSKEAPHILLNLVDAVLDVIGTQGANEYETGLIHLSPPGRTEETGQTESLSGMFQWLVKVLKDVRPLLRKKASSETGVPLTKSQVRGALLELLRKCLLASAGRDKELMKSAVQLAEEFGDPHLLNKLKKLSSLLFLNVEDAEDGPPPKSFGTLLTEQEEFIQLAVQKLESIGIHQVNNIAVKQADIDVPGMSRWSITEDWTPCPIGMLPRGVLPVLDVVTDGVPELSDMKPVELSPYIDKRQASCLGDPADESNSKKMRVIVDSELEAEDLSGGRNGCIMVNGRWKKVTQQELCAIKTVIRSWV